MIGRTPLIGMLLVLVSIVYGCKGTAIPEGNSPEARVYTRRCGTCHPLPEPSRFTFKRWKDLLGLMEMQMARKGLPPLKGEERAMILDYLRRYAAPDEGT